MVKNLTAEQKHILFEEGTESPGSSQLNFEKREGDYYCAGCGTKLFESKQSTIVEVVGHLFLHHYQMYLKQKLITLLDPQEPNIIVKSVVDTTDIFLMMDLNQLEKDIVIMEFV